MGVQLCRAAILGGFLMTFQTMFGLVLQWYMQMVYGCFYYIVNAHYNLFNKYVFELLRENC